MRLPPGLRRLFRLDTGAAQGGPDIRTEIDFHLQAQVDQLVAQGHSIEEARRVALQAFGSPDAVAAQVLQRRRRRVLQHSADSPAAGPVDGHPRSRRRSAGAGRQQGAGRPALAGRGSDRQAAQERPEPGPWLEVIGVVDKIRRRNVRTAPEPEVYYPITQDVTRNPRYVVGISGDPAPVIAAIRSTLSAIDADVPLGNLRPLDDAVAGTLRQPRFLSLLLSLFGGLALLLAAVGIYGVIAFLVTERRREIGVRLALGAPSGRVLRETLWRGMRPVLAGLGIGLLAAVMAGRLASSLFFEVEAADPIALGGAAGVLLLAGIAGSLLPATRAASVEPGVVLRE